MQRIGIAGTGRVARALGRALRDAGAEIVCVAGRHAERTNDAAAFLGNDVSAVSLEEISRQASHLLIAVSDAAIESVAATIAARKGQVRIALHTSGSYGPERLHALGAIGISCGAIHPLQTILGPNALRGIAFSISGDVDALAWAQEIVSRLGGQALFIPPNRRYLYHAAAVMASNYVVALLDASHELMVMAGVPADQALGALGPLARASLENILSRGSVEALTGPIARGDAETVAAHIQALQEAEQDVANLYAAAGIHTVKIAQEKGLSTETAEKIRQALARR